MRDIAFSVPGPPKGKGRPRFARASGRTYTDAKTANWETMCGWHAQEAMQGRAPLEGALELTITAILPIPQSWSERKKDKARLGFIDAGVKPDFDNTMKIVADALSGIVYRDDKQIVSATFSKYYGDMPQTLVRVKEFMTELVA